MAILGHIYRDTWYGGQRCHCCNLTDEGIEAARSIVIVPGKSSSEEK